MGQLSAKLRSTENGPAHWCPACKELHVFFVDKPTHRGARWTWDGNVDRPTFAPSMNISVGPYKWDDGIERTDRCHYFLRAGRIEFLGDCTHELRGQTVDLPDLPNQLKDRLE